MYKRQVGSRSRGFTLLEILVVVSHKVILNLIQDLRRKLSLRPWRSLARCATFALAPWRERVRVAGVMGYIKNFRSGEGVRGRMRGYPLGFTLIEILVVVLIIGILGAIMLPQYQRAVLKSRYAGLMPIAKAMADSNEAYFLEHGVYAANAQDLPVQGRQNYPDGTEIEFGTDTDYSYVLATRDNDFPNNYIVYQKHSTNYPGEIHCEADANDTQAQDVCKSYGPTADIGETLTPGYLTYVLFGTGNGEAPAPICQGIACDAKGNITECNSGQTLNNGSCEDCTTAFPNATACSSTSYAPTACSDGYVVNNGQCEQDPAYAQLQAVAAAQCPDNQTRYVCTIKNGSVSKCDTTYGAIDEETGECVSNGTDSGTFEIVYNPDGTKKQQFECGSVYDGHCVDESIHTLNAGIWSTSKRRVCADKAAISKDLVCEGGQYQYNQTYNSDQTYNSHGVADTHNECSLVNAQGVCTAYNSMEHYDYTYDGNTQKGYVRSGCASISGTTCVDNNYKNTYAEKDSGTARTIVTCFNSSGVFGGIISVNGTCPSGYSIKQQTDDYKTGKRTYKTCSSYNSINWTNATCS